MPRVVPALTSADLERIADAMPVRLRPAVLLAGKLGLRQAEVLAIQRADVDAANRKLRISASATPNGSVLSSKSSGREVVVPARLMSALMRQLTDQGVTDSKAFLFPNRNGEPVRPPQLSSAFRAAAAAAGFSHLRFHDLRALAVTSADGAKRGEPALSAAHGGTWTNARVAGRLRSLHCLPKGASTELTRDEAIELLTELREARRRSSA